MIRKILKGWLGIGALEFQQGRSVQNASTDHRAVEELTETVAKLRGLVSRLDERLEDHKKSCGVSFGWHGEQHRALLVRFDKLDHDLNSDREPGPDPEVHTPIECPKCGRAGLVRAAAIESIDRARPEVTAIIGYGLACPKCKHAFYWQMGRDGVGKMWASDEKLDDDAAESVGAPEPARRPQTVPKVRWSGRRGRA